jgi:hypothetical protein
MANVNTARWGNSRRLLRIRKSFLL